jgi:hypothetical protein
LQRVHRRAIGLQRHDAAPPGANRGAIAIGNPEYIEAPAALGSGLMLDPGDLAHQLKGEVARLAGA